MSSRDTGPRLGRGLAALLGEAAAPAAMIRPIPIAFLEPGPFQPRNAIAPEALAELADSIRRQGVLQPVLARPTPGQANRYQIIAGERRWRAAQVAGLHEIPVLVRDLADSDAMAASLVENLQRQDLNAIEEAEGYRRLVSEFGLTQEELGAAVGKSRSHVANLIRLLQLPPTVRAEVQSGALSAGHARALLSHPDPAKGALQVIARGLNVRQTEAMLHPTRRPKPVRHDETVALEQELSSLLGLKVSVAFDGKAGHVQLHYRSLEQLDAVVALLRHR